MSALNNEEIQDHSAEPSQEIDQLRDSLEKYRDSYEFSPELLASVDPQTATIVDCNHTMMQRLGYPDKRSLIGCNLDQFYHPSCHNKYKQALALFKQFGVVENYELTLRTYTNECIPVLLNVTAVRDEAGKILRSRSAWTDISKLKNAQELASRMQQELVSVEKSLQRSQSDLDRSHVFANVMSEINTDGWWDWDLNDKKKSYISEGFKAILGYRSDEVPNTIRWLRHNTHPDDLEALDNTATNNLEHGVAFRVEARQRCKDGSYRWFIFRGSSIKDANGHNFRMLGTLTDITALKQSEKILQEKNDELSQFGYRTSHDLRSPLIAMNGLCDCILLDIADGELDEAVMNVSRIKERSQVLSTLVSDILSLARADLADEKISTIDTKAFLCELNAMVCELASEKNVELRFEDATLQSLQSQPTRLSQVLYNLVSNSIKYSNENRDCRFVKLRLSSVHGGCCIDIEDNGLGIPEKFQKRLFDRFQRFHPQVAQGSGLGLSIVKSNLDRLHASIEFSSTESGTHFKINLPMTELAPLD